MEPLIYRGRSRRSNRLTAQPAPTERQSPSRDAAERALAGRPRVRATMGPESVNERIVPVSLVQAAKGERGQPGIQHHATRVIWTHVGFSLVSPYLYRRSLQGLPPGSLQPMPRSDRFGLLEGARACFVPTRRVVP